MPAEVMNELVRKIHSSDWQIVLAVTGGGSQAIAELLKVPGASRSVLEAMVPYSEAALVRFLGAKPEHFCSARTARAMAMGAFVRAQQLVQGTKAAAETLVGVGCTASLVSDRPKLGSHRVHVAVQTVAGTSTTSLELAKGLRDRVGEEQLVGELVLLELATACGVRSVAMLSCQANETVTRTTTLASVAWRDLLLGRVPAVRIENGETTATTAVNVPSGASIFPGAFHPLHDGHQAMAALAETITGQPTAFELSVFNVDKPPLDYTEIDTRVKQFANQQTVWLTAAPTFVEKARLFPEATFIVGADTLARIAEPRYYGNDSQRRDAAIAELAAYGCRFLVFGRLMDSNFHVANDLALPDSLRKLCQQVPQDKFRIDLSSTEIRRAND